MSLSPPLPARLAADLADDFAYAGSKIYLNNASVSLMPRPGMDAMRDFLLEYNSVGPDSALADELVTKKMQGVRKIMSGMISCRPDEIVLTQSTTDGINMVAGGLGSLREGASMIIRGMEHEHHANLYPWLRLRDEKNVRIRSLPIDADGFFEVGELESLMDANTGLVVLSHALYNTGAILPVEEAGRIIRRNRGSCRSSSLFFLDAAQTVGCLDAADCDVSRIGCDCMSFNGSKWLCGPMGMGLFYCSREAGRLLEPTAVGGESAMLYDGNGGSDREGEAGRRRAVTGRADIPRLAFKDAPDKFQTGFRNYVGVAGLEASLVYLERIGLGRIRATNRNLSGLLLDELGRLPRVVTYAPADPKRRTSIVPFNVRGADPRRVVERLERQGIVLAVREMGGLTMVRASPHFFNTEEQMHALVDALERL